MNHLTVGQIAERLRADFPHLDRPIMPRELSHLFYTTPILAHVPVIAGRRMVPETMLPVVVSELRRAGKLPLEGYQCRD